MAARELNPWHAYAYRSSLGDLLRIMLQEPGLRMDELQTEPSLYLQMS